jgi:hypothetical protein
LTVREIAAVRQDSGTGQRRWFQDDYFDLFLWQDRAGTPVAFQLCYARGGNEGAISWRETDGFSHARIDTGEHGPLTRRTPILLADGIPPYFRIYARFLAASRGWDPQLHDFMLERLRAYRQMLFGTHRRPRRRGLARR